MCALAWKKSKKGKRFQKNWWKKVSKKRRRRKGDSEQIAQEGGRECVCVCSLFWIRQKRKRKWKCPKIPASGSWERVKQHCKQSLRKFAQGSLSASVWVPKRRPEKNQKDWACMMSKAWEFIYQGAPQELSLFISLVDFVARNWA